MQHDELRPADGPVEAVAHDEPECPGMGLCHGCLKWCNNCGDVDEVCDARLYGEKDGRDHGRPERRAREWCDCHPVPPPMWEVKNLIRNAEVKLMRARRDYEDAAKEMEAFKEIERSRKEMDRQLEELERSEDVIRHIMER